LEFLSLGARCSSRPIPVSYAVLAAIGEYGASIPEIVEMLSRGQMFWTSSPSQIYGEPKRLLALGWITAEKRPGKTRSRTAYRLTSQGRNALRHYLGAPAGFPKLQHQAALRLFAGDMVEDREILASLQKLREDVEQMSKVIDTNIARAPALPHRARYGLLLQDLGRRSLEADADWLDAVERELDHNPHQSTP
jgi:DNA-binding PadR family transcriptional regulator